MSDRGGFHFFATALGMLVLLLTPFTARANSCQISTLASLVGTSCEIGNVFYSFTNMQAARFISNQTTVTDNTILQNVFLFPDTTTISEAVGFFLVSDDFNASGPFGGVNLLIDYTATINSLLNLRFSATTATANAYNISGAFAAAFAETYMDQGCPQQNVAAAGAQSSGTLFDYGASNSATLLCSPNTISGTAEVDVAEAQGGSAVLGSGGFYLSERFPDQIAQGDTGGGTGFSPRLFFPAPEPSSIYVFGTGLLGLAFARSRKSAVRKNEKSTVGPVRQ